MVNKVVYNGFILTSTFLHLWHKWPQNLRFAGL